MTTDKKPTLVMLVTGAPFSIIVIQNLILHGIKPAAIFLPGFPPASVRSSVALPVTHIDDKDAICKLADEQSIPLFYQGRKNGQSFIDGICRLSPDYVLVACWPYRLSQEVIESASKACLNLHPSLLPAYPGPDPIRDQLQNAEVKMGISLHRVTGIMDEGEIVLQESVEFSAADHRTLVEKTLAQKGADLFRQLLM